MNTRNFCIIAHIDHGKSTLADRLLERTGTVSPRAMTEQVLDDMDLEREKGVTIKASPVRMSYQARDGQTYALHLIDTPGHVDFTYEVSRALAACEGALLVVDAAQGIEAQTLANLYLALDHDLEIIPVINKIDLPVAQPDQVAADIENLTGIPAEECLRTSAKEGVGIEDTLEAIVARIPPPQGRPDAPLRALVFDSHYDSYKGVIVYVRIVDGELGPKRMLQFMAHQNEFEPLEIGTFAPRMTPCEQLHAGDVGYVATGLKQIRGIAVGDTVTHADQPAGEALPGYRPIKPMVFAGLYPTESDGYPALRDALEKLQLNDSSLVYQPETSQALGFGFRCGFLGLFHLEIIQERLEREYDVSLLTTAPSVEYHILATSGEELTINRPAALPPENEIAELREPWMEIHIWTPANYIGAVMKLVTDRRGESQEMEYLDEQRVLLTYQIPLSEMIVDFYNQLKAHTRGYASLDYQLAGYRASDLVKMDILINEQVVDALSLITHRNQAYARGLALTRKLKKVIPRQLFKVPIQAAIGSRVIARQTVPAMRKNVLAKCYGGDVTRKRKLLEKQKAGKKRMKRMGKVDIPQEAFMAVLKLEE